MNSSEIKSLGYANFWLVKPDIVKNCTHPKDEENLGDFNHRITCKICKFTYIVNSSD